MNNLAMVLSDQGKYEQAEDILRQELGLGKTILGKGHPSTPMSIKVKIAMVGRPNLQFANILLLICAVADSAPSSLSIYVFNPPSAIMATSLIQSHYSRLFYSFVGSSFLRPGHPQ